MKREETCNVHEQNRLNRLLRSNAYGPMMITFMRNLNQHERKINCTLTLPLNMSTTASSSKSSGNVARSESFSVSSHSPERIFEQNSSCFRFRIWPLLYLFPKSYLLG